jgi:hypothetical protein
MSYDQAKVRNALPVPHDQYGNPGAGGTYNYWDELTLNPPAGAAHASIRMFYQPTSWEYVQFLYLANSGQNAFLADEGRFLLEAWLATGMAEPYAMAQATWGTAPPPPVKDLVIDSLTTWAVDKRGNLTTETDTFTPGSTVGIQAVTMDDVGPLSGAQVFVEIYDSANVQVSSAQGFSDADGFAVLKWKTSRKQATDTYTAKVVNAIKSGYVFNPGAGVTAVSFTIGK